MKPLLLSALALFAASGLRAETIVYHVFLDQPPPHAHVVLQCGSRRIAESDTRGDVAVFTIEPPEGELTATADGYESKSFLDTLERDDLGRRIFGTILKPAAPVADEVSLPQAYVARHPQLAPAIRDAILKGTLEIGMTEDDARAALGELHRTSSDKDADGPFTLWGHEAAEASYELRFRSGHLDRWEATVKPPPTPGN